MIDRNGFRLNVGIIITNKEGKLFWGQSYTRDYVWQFPQGGVDPYETLTETMYREIKEEINLNKEDVKILKLTTKWLYYKLPEKYKRKDNEPKFVGQKQKWFLVKLIGSEDSIKFNNTSTPEFQGYRWVDYWYPLRKIVFFKKASYKEALTELEPYHAKEYKTQKNKSN